MKTYYPAERKSIFMADIKTLVQCDFDGTVTEEDVSFMLLDSYARGDWRERLKEYEAGRITVGRFNTEAFSMVKADRASLVKAALEGVRIREGFEEFVAYCRRKGFRLVIISNGLDFYIKEILSDIGLDGIEVFAALTSFRPDGGLDVRYISPDGRCLDDNFKSSYVSSFLEEGYRVIYVGNGASDFLAASRSHHVFATGTLLSHCRERNLDCIPFDDFGEVVRGMESLR
ncbi:MAG: MtnX-like HAD-IB family phosphatase [Chloroflexi bacterium]|nr:MtnX-like HAD-IB family phosphatase [Chloroflexota bacterium]